MIWLTTRNDISPASSLMVCWSVCRVLAWTYASYGALSANWIVWSSSWTATGAAATEDHLQPTASSVTGPR
jgi:hypothetical protein